MSLDAVEEMKHQGATVGCQRQVGAVEQGVGQVGRKRHQGVEGFWNRTKEHRM